MNGLMFWTVLNATLCWYLKLLKRARGDLHLIIAIAMAHPRRASFRLFAIGELVGYKPCAILAASWWVSGDGQCRDKTQ